MGEALMFRAGGGQGGDSGGNYEFCTQIFTNNTTFVMPDGVKNGQVYVRIFGGGGGGKDNGSFYSGAGGRGYQFGGGAGGNSNGANGSYSVGNTSSKINADDLINTDGIGAGINGDRGSGRGWGANGGEWTYGGGGGYGKDGWGGHGWRAPAGGGAYGHGGYYTYNEASGASETINPTHGGGGGCTTKGANGICLIWYYKKT